EPIPRRERDVSIDHRRAPFPERRLEDRTAERHGPRSVNAPGPRYGQASTTRRLSRARNGPPEPENLISSSDTSTGVKRVTHRVDQEFAGIPLGAKDPSST